MEEKTTPLFETHKQLGARMAPFGGWNMPLYYSKPVDEHLWTRAHCGIFDVSHMGQVFISGNDAENYVNYICSNNITKLQEGRGQYNVFLNEQAGVIDDLFLYKLAANSFLLCINAANIEKDLNWIHKQLTDAFDIQIDDKCSEYSQVAVQGPTSTEVLKSILTDSQASDLESLKFTDIKSFDIDNQNCLIARTGYTGEHGYEIYLPNEAVVSCFTKLIEHPEARPCGLSARDSLRLEAGYVLYGNELNETISPYEAGISWCVKTDKPQFIGKQAAETIKSAGTQRLLFGFELVDKGVARAQMKIFKGDKEVGFVSSGAQLPSVNFMGGMAFLNRFDIEVGDKVEIDVRGKRKLAIIRKRPLYDARTK